MGRGSSSDACWCAEDGSEEELVLKVACDIAHNDRLVAEGEVLCPLHHQNIVAHRETLTVAGRTALLLKSAGARKIWPRSSRKKAACRSTCCSASAKS
jgi:hypothetical protein